MMHEWVCCYDKAANPQLPIAAAFWIFWIVSTEEWSSLTQNLMEIRCSNHSAILNAMATQHTLSLNGVYRPHWLVQWSRHCSHMHIPVHSPWQPGYTDVTETVVILTMAGIFPDRLCVCIHTYSHTYMFDGILFSNKKDQNLAICDNVNRHRSHYSKWNKSDKERQMLCNFSYMWTQIMNKTKTGS